MHTNKIQDIRSNRPDRIEENNGSLIADFRQGERYIDDNTDNTIRVNDSIYNNIKAANPNATKHDIILAAEKAQVLDFAWELPKGLDTLINYNKQLSVEQQQQIQLAREFLKTLS